MFINFFKINTWVAAFNVVLLTVFGAINVQNSTGNILFKAGLANLVLFLACYFIWAYLKDKQKPAGR